MLHIKLLLIAIIVAIPLSSHAIPQSKLSNQTEVSLLTCGPGKNIYAKFGHSGIRFYDKINDIDIVFHWGIFSFEKPGFIFRFMLGKIDYEMGAFYMDDFYTEYQTRGSYLISQPINISLNQKQKLWDTLWNDFFSEKRYYNYNFISANCATKACDAILNLFNDTICFDYSIEDLSYRDIINQHIDKNSWFNTGINLIIGSKADTLLQANATASFPSYTKQFIAHTYLSKFGKKKPIVGPEQQLLKQTKEYTPPHYLFWIQIIIPLLIIGAQILHFIYFHKYIPILTNITLLIYGLIGVIICFLWFYSYHPIVSNNYNLLWLNPINVIICILLPINNSYKIKLWFTYLASFITILYFIPIIFNLQYYSIHILLWWLLGLTTLLCTIATLRYKKEELKQ